MKSIFRNVCFAVLTALCAVALASCEDDDTKSGDLRIFYPTVSDIGPSMNFTSGTPTYYGPAPTNFSISGITLDDKTVESQSFAISAESGIVTITNTEELGTGVYKLSISCQAGGAPYTFRDVFVVTMVPATPEAVEVSAPTLEIPYAELETTEASVTVKPVGESVNILSYALVQPEGEEYFSISLKGIVTLNANFKGEVMPGIYSLPIKVTTHAGSAVYEDLLTAKITSEPLAVKYPSASGRMEFDMAFHSSTPTLKGSPEDVVWAIKQVLPLEEAPATDKIVIDPATGVVSVEAGNGLPIDAQYALDLSVTNAYGTADFEGAYLLSVIAYIAPIEAETFAYDAAETIQGGEFTAVRKDGFVGDEVTFSLGELPAGLEGQISIDEMTGTISAVKGHSIPLGAYEIPVKAANIKGEVETKLALTVSENPYYFTTISYGNNLGLAPAENYASQYRCPAAGDLTALELMPTTDAKAGTKLSWSVAIRHQCSGTTIDSETGMIKPKGFKANNGGMILVTATAGEGQKGETSVTVPVFFSFIQTVSDVTVGYTPFVMQVNPRKGGTFVAPVVTGVKAAQFLMDYRRTFTYYNIGGPASHKDGQSTVVGSFANQMWAAYYASVGELTVDGAKRAPVSYYDNQSRLSSTLCYVEPATKSLVVNPNKWVAADGVAANGAFFGQMTFVTNGNSGDVSGSKNQIFPIWVWFDEKF